ncbi:MAG TPA: ribbon-helix-helix protein, CopG family [Phormidium sp.]
MLISEKKALGGKRKAELISVYVKPEVKERLERWADKEERSVSWIIAKLIEQALAEGKDGAEEKL